MHHCLWEKAHDELLAVIKEQDKRIVDLEEHIERLKEDVHHYKDYGDLWMKIAKIE